MSLLFAGLRFPFQAVISELNFIQLFFAIQTFPLRIIISYTTSPNGNFATIHILLQILILNWHSIQISGNF